MSSISAIQRSDELYGIYSPQKQTRPGSATSVNPFSGSDTVEFSEEALAMLGKSKEKEEEGGAEALFDTISEETASTSVDQTSLKDMGKSMFAIMLESLFLADLEENAEATAQAAEDGMPAKKSSPLADSGKAAEIKKLMNDVASGKADISDLPKAMAVKSGGGAQTDSPVTKKTGAASAKDDAPSA